MRVVYRISPVCGPRHRHSWRVRRLCNLVRDREVKRVRALWRRLRVAHP
jgi:hypothetical protein